MQRYLITHCPITTSHSNSKPADSSTWGGGGVGRRWPVVFLQHGLLSSSADWVLEGTEKGLGMQKNEQQYQRYLNDALKYGKKS